MTSTDQRRQHLLPWQVVFVLLAATWGCSFWWIKLGLQMLAPVQVAFVRLAIGASALIVLSVITGARLPRSISTWRHLFVVAMLMNSDWRLSHTDRIKQSRSDRSTEPCLRCATLAVIGAGDAPAVAGDSRCQP